MKITDRRAGRKTEETEEETPTVEQEEKAALDEAASCCLAELDDALARLKDEKDARERVEEEAQAWDEYHAIMVHRVEARRAGLLSPTAEMAVWKAKYGHLHLVDCCTGELIADLRW